MRKFISLLTVGLITLVILAACAPSGSTSAVDVKQPAEDQAGATTIAASPAPTEAGAQEALPADSPEAAVTAFLNAYQENPGGMENYLSSAAKAALGDQEAGSLLKFGYGALEGFGIQSAFVNPEAPAAMVEVAVRAAGMDSLRRFHLTKENGSWVIDSVEVPEG